MKFGIFTKPHHVEKLEKYLTENTSIKDFFISTDLQGPYTKEFDIGVSYCFPRIVDLDKSPMPWFNYHPAPLPQYKGAHVYAEGINDSVREWGVTFHRMIQEVDAGPIIKKRIFSLDSAPTVIDELGSISHYYLFQLFKETIESLPEYLSAKE